MDMIYLYDITNRSEWDLSYSWGNHALAGYITSIKGLFSNLSNFTAYLTDAKWCAYNATSGLIECNVDVVVDTNTNCSGATCEVANTGTLDGYEAADLLDGGLYYYWDKTSATYDGDGASNYSNANALCAAEHADSAVCSLQNMLDTIRDKSPASTHANWSGTAWIIGGAPGYTADANDCLGLTSDDSTDYGRFWNFDEAATGDGMGWLTGCNQVKGFACCKKW